MTDAEILELVIKVETFDRITVANYFLALLQAVWAQGEGFSGKRPFGNSGWEYNLVSAIGVAGGFPTENEGTDEDPDLVLIDEDAAINRISILLKNVTLVAINRTQE